MELRKVEKGIQVWQTGSQKNSCYYDSREDIAKYNRRRLSSVHDFLIEENESKYVEVIGQYLGKIIKIKSVPQLIPVGNYRINTSLNYLVDSIKSYQEEYNLDLDPDFQRHHVWSLKQRISFVEFVLQGGKCPPIYFNYPKFMRGFKEDDIMVIVDGKQRLTSLLMFLNNEFPIFKNLDKEDGVGFYAKEFDRLGADIEIVINDLESKEQVLEWYLQINKGQVAHTDEEIQKVENMLSDIRK